MALWMRTQCNLVLAQIADDIDAAVSYLADARTVLDIFKEDRMHCPDPKTNVQAMEASFEDVEQQIAYRREHPWNIVDQDDDTTVTGLEAEPETFVTDEEGEALPGDEAGVVDSEDIRASEPSSESQGVLKEVTSDTTVRSESSDKEDKA